MKKEFAPYKQSLELKELGFDEPCFGYYLNEKLNIFHSTSVKDRINSKTKDIFSSVETTSPLYQQAFRWFREKYNLDSSMSRDVWNTYSTTYRITGGVKGIVEANSHGALYDIDSKDYDSYEEAELECLKKLIEIVKDK